MAKITRIKPPKGNDIHSYVVASDWHSFHLCPDTFLSLKKLAKKIPRGQRRLIILGDFLDCEHLMGKPTDFKRWIRDTFTLEELSILSEEEFEWGNKTLDELQNIFDYIYFVEGNHDWRYRNFKNEWCPHNYKHNFDIEKQLQFKERGIPYINYNDWLDIGEIAFSHGMYHGSTHLKKHYETCGKSVMYGHVHHADSKSFVVRGKTKKAWSLPAMCLLNPCYIKNRENNWSNGFATVHVKSNGHFNTHIHEVWDGEYIDCYGKRL